MSAEQVSRGREEGTGDGRPGTEDGGRKTDSGIGLRSPVSGPPSQADPRTILRERARALARVPEQAGTARESLDVLEFRLGSETCAIETAFVREVYPLKDFTPLPGTPAFVLGIVNIRGQILSVVDLRKLLNQPDRGLGELNKVIIIRNDRMEFGILADAILGTHSISRTAIQPPLPTVTGTGAEYLRGVTAERVIILDAERILGDEQIIAYHETV